MFSADELEEFFLEIMQRSTVKKWFIIRKNQQVMYYLKEYDEKKKAVVWTANLSAARPFANNASANEYIKAFSLNGRYEDIIEIEV